MHSFIITRYFLDEELFSTLDSVVVRLLCILTMLIDNQELPSYSGQQGFMQNQIIASHTCFGGHIDINC